MDGRPMPLAASPAVLANEAGCSKRPMLSTPCFMMGPSPTDARHATSLFSRNLRIGLRDFVVQLSSGSQLRLRRGA